MKQSSGISSRYISIKEEKIKDKERILKAARKYQLVPYRGTSIRLQQLGKKKKERKKDIQVGNKELKSSPFSDDIVLDKENPKYSAINSVKL